MKVADNSKEVRAGLHVPAEAHREPAEPPQNRGPTHGDEALDHDRQDVLAPYQAAIEKGQPWCHEHDQAGAQEHEAGIAGIEMKHIGKRYVTLKLLNTPPLFRGTIIRSVS